MQKNLTRSICRLDCGLGWAEASTSSIIFASWRQCTQRHSVKTAEPINLPFGLWTPVGWRKHKFSHVHQVVPMYPHGRAHWCHLVNTIAPFICYDDAALCQITLTTCYCLLVNIAAVGIVLCRLTFIFRSEVAACYARRKEDGLGANNSNLVNNSNLLQAQLVNCRLGHSHYRCGGCTGYHRN